MLKQLMSGLTLTAALLFNANAVLADTETDAPSETKEQAKNTSNERYYNKMYLVTEIPSGFEENVLEGDTDVIWGAPEAGWEIRFKFFPDPDNLFSIDPAINGLHQYIKKDERFTLVRHNVMKIDDLDVFYFQYHFAATKQYMAISEYYILETDEGAYAVSFTGPLSDFDRSFIKGVLESTFFGKTQ